MTNLTPLEREVLTRSLATNAVPDAVRDQLNHVRVNRREESGVGIFVHLFVPPEVVNEGVKGLDQQVGDVIAEVPGVQHGLGFVVFVKDGVLNMLEGYTFGDDEWPADLSVYRLRSATEP